MDERKEKYLKILEEQHKGLIEQIRKMSELCDDGLVWIAIVEAMRLAHDLEKEIYRVGGE